MISIKNLSKSYNQGNKKLEILKKLDCNIKDKEKVAIIGASGSGKTTLLSILTGLDRQDEGSIELGGVKLESLSEKEMTDFRKENMGIVFQQFHLFSHLTALENIALPLQLKGLENSEAKAKEFLELVKLGERGSHLPSELSGGECQRVGLARALALSPKFIFADEPTGSLDETTGDDIINLLFSLTDKVDSTLVLITHNPQLANKCDRTLELKNGVLS